jgi:hypothetical protein
MYQHQEEAQKIASRVQIIYVEIFSWQHSSQIVAFLILDKIASSWLVKIYLVKIRLNTSLILSDSLFKGQKNLF